MLQKKSVQWTCLSPTRLHPKNHLLLNRCHPPVLTRVTQRIWYARQHSVLFISINMHQLQFDDLVIHVTRKAIKHMYVRIKAPDGQVCVTIPQRASLDLIKRQLEVKLEWIRSRRMLQIIKSQQMTPAIIAGEHVPYLGKHYTLAFQPGGRSHTINLQDDIMYLSAASDTSTDATLRLINHWYRQQLQSLLPGLIAKWEPIVGVRVATIAIRMMKTRWGSCNTRTGRICLNLNLIKKPLACLEYVIVHEMVHLHEASHNKRFYNLMNQFMPGWQMHHGILEPGSRHARTREAESQ